MSSSARHQDDFESPVKVAEMKQDNLKDYKRWKKESGVLQEALDEVKQCAVLQHKSLILKSLKNTLNEHENGYQIKSQVGTITEFVLIK